VIRGNGLPSGLITGVLSQIRPERKAAMRVSHASAAAVTSTDETAAQAGSEVPGTLEVLALAPDMRKRRGRRFAAVFILAIAVPRVLAGAKSFREFGDPYL
jgi:hypothetical protein